MTQHKIRKVAVLSDGAWGTAIALLLNQRGLEVAMWGPFPENIREIRKTGENKKFLPGTKIPSEIKLCEEIGETATDADLIVLASPSQYMRGTLGKLKPFFRKEQILVNLAKGIETSSLKRMSELCSEILGKTRYCVLSGPSHAEEVSKNIPTAVVVASKNHDDAQLVQEAFMTPKFRIYSSEDVVGVELGGSLKNVFAIAAGILDGMGFGDNPKAALITRGSVEISRIGVELGGQTGTFYGLSGVGDLIVTCYSRHSRNRHVGEELGRGKKLGEILADMGLAVAEGVATAESAFKLAEKHEIDAPIIDEVYQVLYKNKKPDLAVHDLMTRKPKKEVE